MPKPKPGRALQERDSAQGEDNGKPRRGQKRAGRGEADVSTNSSAKSIESTKSIAVEDLTAANDG